MIFSQMKPLKIKKQKKKNEQNTTSKTEDETKKSDSKNGDGWSELY